MELSHEQCDILDWCGGIVHLWCWGIYCFDGCRLGSGKGSLRGIEANNVPY
ncbi:hypothetical protein [Photobacterium damselae]|uniref:hypothetical protein n=1 Tax=Photobacterium damselae TaxID=38293 RepID=UPI0040685B55